MGAGVTGHRISMQGLGIFIASLLMFVNESGLRLRCSFLRQGREGPSAGFDELAEALHEMQPERMDRGREDAENDIEGEQQHDPGRRGQRRQDDVLGVEERDHEHGTQFVQKIECAEGKGDVRGHGNAPACRG